MRLDMTQEIALLLTLSLELPVVAALVLGLRWCPRSRWPWLLLLAAATSLITHPFAWHGIPELRASIPSYWARTALVEGLVVVAEGLLYMHFLPLSVRRGMATALLANGVSWGLGLLLQVGWHHGWL